MITLRFEIFSNINMEYPDFYIKRLSIENFKGIKHFSYEDFGKKMNIVVGINGAGKSTLLRAIDILFSWFSARIKNAKGNGITINDNDITHGESDCTMEIELSNGTCWKLYKQRSSSRKKTSGKSQLSDMTTYVNEILIHNEEHSDNIFLPLYCYYSVNRVVEKTPDKFHKDNAMSHIDVYNKDIESAQNYRALFRWFNERENIENAIFRRDPLNFVEDKQLKAVRSAIEGIMPGYSNLHINIHPKTFVLNKNGEEFLFDSLSDGEKAHIALVADIARKLSMSHPNSEKPLECPAIILIDEIDLHLHPSWQRDVLPKMREVFKGCQFIVTTHSPFVLTNVNVNEGDRLMMVKDGTIELLKNNIFGREISLILGEVLQMPQMRNAEAEKHIAEVWKCLANGDDISTTFMEHYNWLQTHIEPSDLLFTNIEIQKRIIAKNRLKNETD